MPALIKTQVLSKPLERGLLYPKLALLVKDKDLQIVGYQTTHQVDCQPRGEAVEPLYPTVATKTCWIL